MNPPHVCHLVWEVDEGQETKELWICTAINRRSLSRNVGGRLANHQVHLFTFENSAFQLLFAFNPTSPLFAHFCLSSCHLLFFIHCCNKNSLIFPQPVWIRRLDTGQRSRVLTRARLLPSSRPPRLSLGCWPPPEPHHVTLGHGGVSTTPQQAPFFFLMLSSQPLVSCLLQNQLCKILSISIYSLFNISCSYNFVWFKLGGYLLSFITLLFWISVLFQPPIQKVVNGWEEGGRWVPGIEKPRHFWV